MKGSSVDTPAPKRGSRTPWGTFLRAHMGKIAAADFFTIEVVGLFKLARYYVFFVIDLATRKVEIAGITQQPDGVCADGVDGRRLRRGRDLCSLWIGDRALSSCNVWRAARGVEAGRASERGNRFREHEGVTRESWDVVSSRFRSFQILSRAHEGSRSAGNHSNESERVPPCQGGRRGFEPLLPLKISRG
jgi:hypothetical protein